MPSRKVVIDTSVLVGLINPRDTWHAHAITLRGALQTADVEIVYFDCVVGEAISVVARRLEEQRRSHEFTIVLDRLRNQIPTTALSWILPDVPQQFNAILDLMHTSSGALNFNDALIALACQERAIPTIASFDPDFDAIGWLKRISQPQDIA